MLETTSLKSSNSWSTVQKERKRRKRGVFGVTTNTPISSFYTLLKAT